MARRKTPKPPGVAPAELVPRLRAAVEVLDEALERLARTKQPARRRGSRPKGENR